MTQGVPIDRAEIHRKIWKARDRTGKVKIYQKRFAETLGISAPHMSRIIGELIESGRLHKVGARYRNVGVYSVSDPAQFSDPDASLKSVGVGPATRS